MTVAVATIQRKAIIAKDLNLHPKKDFLSKLLCNFKSSDYSRYGRHAKSGHTKGGNA